MGILNVTPDSFSDGGKFLDAGKAVDHAMAMVDGGADIIDVGGESSRPGAEAVSIEEELRRVIPVIEALRSRTDAALSIDTTKAAVARAAVEAGADIVNDITALRGDGAMAEAVASSDAGLVLMHMLGEPRTMQANPQYGDVVGEIKDFLLERAAWAEGRGVERDRIAFDPGIGFGKTLEHNLEIFRRLEELVSLDRPLLVGPSRKSFLWRILENAGGKKIDAQSKESLQGTAAAVAVSVSKGASIVRVHDVRETVSVVEVARAMR